MLSPAPYRSPVRRQSSAASFAEHRYQPPPASPAAPKRWQPLPPRSVHAVQRSLSNSSGTQSSGVGGSTSVAALLASRPTPTSSAAYSTLLSTPGAYTEYRSPLSISLAKRSFSMIPGTTSPASPRGAAVLATTDQSQFVSMAARSYSRQSAAELSHDKRAWSTAERELAKQRRAKEAQLNAVLFAPRTRSSSSSSSSSHSAAPSAPHAQARRGGVASPVPTWSAATGLTTVDRSTLPSKADYFEAAEIVICPRCQTAARAPQRCQAFVCYKCRQLVSALLPEATLAAPAVSPTLRSISRQQGHRIDSLTAKLTELQLDSASASSAAASRGTAAWGRSAAMEHSVRKATPIDGGPSSPSGRPLWAVELDVGQAVQQMGAADKEAGIDALRAIAWATSSPSLAEPSSESTSAAAPTTTTEDHDKTSWNQLTTADRQAFELLGWTAASYEADAGPTISWTELTADQQFAAMTLGYDEGAWIEAVEAEQQDAEERAIVEAAAAEQRAREQSAREIDLFIMSLSSEASIPGAVGV